MIFKIYSTLSLSSIFFCFFHFCANILSLRDIISGLKNLDMLILAHNQLKYVPARVFSNLSQLNSLELDGNHIIGVDDEAFYGLEGELFEFIRSI